jgi:hypothetical protein
LTVRPLNDDFSAFLFRTLRIVFRPLKKCPSGTGFPPAGSEPSCVQNHAMAGLG